MSYVVAIIESAVNLSLVYWLYPRLGLGLTLSSLVGEALRAGTNGLVLVFAIAPLAAGVLYFVGLFYAVPSLVVAPLAAWLSVWIFPAAPRTARAPLVILAASNLALFLVGRKLAPARWYPVELERVCPLWLLIALLIAEAALVAMLTHVLTRRLAEIAAARASRDT